MGHSRTIRWTRVENPQRLIQALVSHRSPARCEAVAVFDRVYARTFAADTLLEESLFHGGWFLADQTEVFLLESANPPLALNIANLLTGVGGLSSVTEVHIEGAEILVELAGSPQLLFAFIDQCLGPGTIKRRAVLKLHDTTLCQMASAAWNCEDLDPQRILEVAAGEDTW